MGISVYSGRFLTACRNDRGVKCHSDDRRNPLEEYIVIPRYNPIFIGQKEENDMNSYRFRQLINQNGKVFIYWFIACYKNMSLVVESYPQPSKGGFPKALALHRFLCDLPFRGKMGGDD